MTEGATNLISFFFYNLVSSPLPLVMVSVDLSSAGETTWLRARAGRSACVGVAKVSLRFGARVARTGGVAVMQRKWRAGEVAMVGLAWWGSSAEVSWWWRGDLRWQVLAMVRMVRSNDELDDMTWTVKYSKLGIPSNKTPMSLFESFSSFVLFFFLLVLEAKTPIRCCCSEFATTKTPKIKRI